MSMLVDLCIHIAIGTLAGQIAGLWLQSLSLGADGDGFIGSIGGVGGAQILQAMAPEISNSISAEPAGAIAQLAASIGGGAFSVIIFGALACRTDHQRVP
jgi:hypothetical protein